MEPLLELQDLKFAYSGSRQPVLDGLTLTINEGEPLAIIGPNGSGKTTLLHLILGWLTPAKGSLHLNGKRFAEYSRRELGQLLALVPQNEPVSFEFSALDYVLFGRAPYLAPLELPSTSDQNIAFAALEKVGLSALANRSIMAMSGGEKQLLLIARALAQQSKTILLDEPTTHLDLGNPARRTNLLRQLAREGHNLIFTTHEPDFALALSERTVMMQRGQILYDGETSSVINSASLTDLYASPVEVIDHEGRFLISWDNPAKS
jgi:iron complex transport system ATP-binding protein